MWLQLEVTQWQGLWSSALPATAKALHWAQDCTPPKGSHPCTVHLALFTSTNMVSRLCKHAEGSAFATRKLKHLPARDRSESKGQPAIPTPGCKFLLWQAEIHPNRLPQLLVADDVANRHVWVQEWWARTAPSALSIIHPAGCLKGTGLSHPSHPSLMTLRKLLSH